MSKKIRYTRGELPALTDEQKAQLARLAARPESEIDTSDAPVLPQEAWEGAVRGRFFKPVKQPVTTRIDSDVISWLKSKEGPYQTHMNQVLRAVMIMEGIMTANQSPAFSDDKKALLATIQELQALYLKSDKKERVVLEVEVEQSKIGRLDESLFKQLEGAFYKEASV